MPIYIRQGNQGNLSHPAAKQRGSPNPGSQDSRSILGPRSSNQRCIRLLEGPFKDSKLFRLNSPSHQSSIPPRVLPIVATIMATQYKCGLTETYPNKMGSEPTGNKVAEIKALINTAGKPTDGIPKKSKNWPSICSIRQALRVGWKSRIWSCPKYAPSPITLNNQVDKGKILDRPQSWILA